jgi:hypothetical protein
MTNYKPMSLLTVFSKVLKKAIHIRLNHHLHTDIILVTRRYGFRKMISTEDAACRLTDSVFISINPKMHDREMFCDLAEAFNCMDHEILLAKLLLYRIRGVSEDWLKSYVTKFLCN